MAAVPQFVCKPAPERFKSIDSRQRAAASRCALQRTAVAERHNAESGLQQCPVYFSTRSPLPGGPPQRRKTHHWGLRGGRVDLREYPTCRGLICRSDSCAVNPILNGAHRYPSRRYWFRIVGQAHPAEILPRKCLIDHRNWICVRVIFIVEWTASQDKGARNPEVFRADTDGAGARPVPSGGSGPCPGRMAVSGPIFSSGSALVIAADCTPGRACKHGSVVRQSFSAFPAGPGSWVASEPSDTGEINTSAPDHLRDHAIFARRNCSGLCMGTGRTRYSRRSNDRHSS